MDPDLGKIIAQLPPEQVFPFVRDFVAHTLYPELGRAFWIQLYIAVAWLACIALSIWIGLWLAVTKGRVRIMLQDGMATRPHIRFWVPLFWSLYAALKTAHAVWLSVAFRHHTVPRGFEIFWWYIPINLSFSYAIISTSVVASLPAVRGALQKLNNKSRQKRSLVPTSVITLNTLLVAYCAGILFGILPGALLASSGWSKMATAWQGAVDLVDTAASTQNVATLSQLPHFFQDMLNGRAVEAHGQKITGRIYAGYTLACALSGVIPGFALNRVLRRKLESLDNGASTSGGQVGSGSAQPTDPSPIRVTLGDSTPDQYKDADQKKQHSEIDSDHVLRTQSSSNFLAGGETYQPQPQVEVEVRLPRDRPFGNLVPASPLLPPRFANIVQDKSVSKQERAARLRAALRTENRLLTSYILLLLFLSSLIIFLAAGGQAKLSARLNIVIPFVWETYSFLIAGSFCAGVVLYDGLRPGPGSLSDTSSDNSVEASARHKKSASTGPRFPVIQLQQTVDVDVVRDIEMEEKSPKISYGRAT